VEGNAREFGALFELPFSAYPLRKADARKKAPRIAASIESDRVLSYELTRVNGVKAAKSPFAIETLLRRSGINPKYDLVDITNFVMTELGQPMHAFDADKVEGKIIVRLAKDGEKILALDGKEYGLSKEDLVIADEKKVLAVAGVIGGASSAVSDTTENVIFESATFDPVSVRLTAQRIGCRTDASTRFEKSLDPRLTPRGMDRALSLLEFLGKNADIAGDFAYLDEKRLKTAEISFPLSFVETKLGIAIPSADVKRILEALGFAANVSGTDVTVGVPSWRVTKDVSIKEDVVEEIGRVYGYDKIQEKPFTAPYDIAAKNRELAFRNLLLSHFTACGYFEAYTYSFSNEEKDRSVGFADMDDAIRVINAVSAEYTHMRRSPAPLLIGAAAENLKRSEKFAFIEYGKIHRKAGEKFTETRSLAGISVGKPVTAVRDDITAFVRTAVPTGEISVGQGIDVAKTPFLHPGKSGSILLDGRQVAVFGTLHPKVAANYGLESAEGAYFEFDVPVLMAAHFEKSEPRFNEPGKFPGVTRELNFVMDDRALAGDAAAVIAACDPRVKSVVVADVFRSAEKVGEGKKSVTFSFEIEDSAKTITDEEALAIQKHVVSEMEKRGFPLRAA
jgi:phenylalanyl-tRNA synthetase beta chain